MTRLRQDHVYMVHFQATADFTLPKTAHTDTAVAVELSTENLGVNMEKKESNLEDELAEQIQKLYEKYVPANVREYIDDKQEESKVKKSGNSAKIKDESINHF